MTDFLTRLIGRNLGQWPVVQPQINSLYAPSPALAGLDEMTEDAVSGLASSPPASATDAPMGDPTPPAPTASSPAPDRPASIPSLFASSDRPTLPLTRLPRPIAPLPASQPPSDSISPPQTPPFPEAVPVSDSLERPSPPLEPATPIPNVPGENSEPTTLRETNLSVENSEPNAPQVRLAPDSSNPPSAAISQAVAPSSSLPAAQSVSSTSSAEYAIVPTPLPQATPILAVPEAAQSVSSTSSAEYAIAPTPLPQATPILAVPEKAGASTLSVPPGSATEVQLLSPQPAPSRAIQSNELYPIRGTNPPFPNDQTIETNGIRPAKAGVTKQDLRSEGSEAIAIGQNASSSPSLVRPLDLRRQEPATADDRLQGATTPSESFPPVMAPLLPTVTPALVVPAAVDPAPQSLRQGGLAAAPAMPTIHVTIGRIDVRAITPPSSPPSRARRSSPTPQLSLNDYLTSRDQTP